MNQERVRKLANRVLDHPRSKATEEQYRRMAERLKQAGQTPWEYAEQRQLTKPTYYAYRAAWILHKANEALSKLTELDRARRAGDRETATELREGLKYLEALLEDADPDGQHCSDPESHPGYREKAGRKKASQRRAIRGLSYDWPMRIIAELTNNKDQGIAALLMITGARPRELADGKVYVRSTDGGGIEVWVEGVKTDRGHGQAWRRFIVYGSQSNSQALGELIANIANDLATDWDDANLPFDPDAFRGRFRRAAHRALGRSVAPYALRHQFASELKRTLGDEDAVSAALGHSVSHTRRHYGLTGQGSGLFHVLEVEAENPVKRKPGPETESELGPR